MCECKVTIHNLLQVPPVFYATFQWRNWPGLITNGWRWLIRSEPPEQSSSAPQTTRLRWREEAVGPRPRETTRAADRERVRDEEVSELGINPERLRQAISDDWMLEDSVTAQISWITKKMFIFCYRCFKSEKKTFLLISFKIKAIESNKKFVLFNQILQKVDTAVTSR